MTYYSLWIFSIKCTHHSNWFIYQSIELDLLNKTVYKTFLYTFNIEWKKTQNSVFFTYRKRNNRIKKSDLLKRSRRKLLWPKDLQKNLIDRRKIKNKSDWLMKNIWLVEVKPRINHIRLILRDWEWLPKIPWTYPL